MGEAKRRKEALGEKYGQSQTFFGVSKERGMQMYRWTMRGAWIGVGITIAFWLTVRFIGPALGWWELQD